MRGTNVKTIQFLSLLHSSTKVKPKEFLEMNHRHSLIHVYFLLSGSTMNKTNDWSRIFTQSANLQHSKQLRQRHYLNPILLFSIMDI